MNKNEGFNPQKIKEFREEMKKANKPFLIIESEDNSDEYVNFYFIGKYEGKEVVYDAVIYTLRLFHQSELYEIAEHKAAKKFPSFKKIKYKEDENGDLVALDPLEEEIGLFITEVMLDLEEEEAVKVKEHVEIDPNIDFGIGLDVALNVEEVNDNVIRKFINDYNDANLRLDDTEYSFQTEDEEEEEVN
jgi:hypothetical protein